MDNINVTLNIKDIAIRKCNRNVYEKEVTVTSFMQVICLLDSYILNVISADDSKCTIIIQNGQNVIIRNIFDYETEICLPSSCYNHYLIISCNRN